MRYYQLSSNIWTCVLPLGGKADQPRPMMPRWWVLSLELTIRVCLDTLEVDTPIMGIDSIDRKLYFLCNKTMLLRINNTRRILLLIFSIPHFIPASSWEENKWRVLYSLLYLHYWQKKFRIRTCNTTVTIYYYSHRTGATIAWGCRLLLTPNLQLSCLIVDTTPYKTATVTVRQWEYGHVEDLPISVFCMVDVWPKSIGVSLLCRAITITNYI